MEDIEEISSLREEELFSLYHLTLVDPFSCCFVDRALWRGLNDDPRSYTNGCGQESQNDGWKTSFCPSN